MKHYKSTFRDGDFILEVIKSSKDDSIWLSVKDMSLIFDKNVRTIQRTIQSVNGQKCDKNNNDSDKNVAPKTIRINGVEYHNLRTLNLVGEKYYCPRYIAFIRWINETKQNQYSSIESNIIRFEVDNISLDVNVSPQENTVWLTQNQIAILFETSQSNISKHIKNVVEASNIYRSVHEKNSYTDIVTKEDQDK